MKLVAIGQRALWVLITSSALRIKHLAQLPSQDSGEPRGPCRMCAHYACPPATPRSPGHLTIDQLPGLQSRKEDFSDGGSRSRCRWAHDNRRSSRETYAPHPTTSNQRGKTRAQLPLPAALYTIDPPVTCLRGPPVMRLPSVLQRLHLQQGSNSCIYAGYEHHNKNNG